MACLYVSTKMHDTLKKPRDILLVSYTVRFPELAARQKAMAGDIEVDPAVRIHPLFFTSSTELLV
jgi:CTD kinase subunit beta